MNRRLIACLSAALALGAMGASQEAPATLVGVPADDHQPAWSPDGTRIAFSRSTDGAEEVFVLDLATSQASPIGPGQNPAWNPDSQRLAVDTTEGIMILYLTGESQLLPNTAGGRFPTWSPGGDQIAYSLDNNLFVLDIIPGAQPIALTTSRDSLDPAWSRDNKLVFVRNVPGGSVIATLDLTSCTPPVIPVGAFAAYSAPVVSPGPAVSPGPEGPSQAVSTCQITQVTGTGPGRARDSQPAWSPDGRSIAFARAGDGGRRDIFLINADGTSERQVTSGGRDNTPTFSPDGRLAYAFGGTGGTAGFDLNVVTLAAAPATTTPVTTTPVETTPPPTETMPTTTTPAETTPQTPTTTTTTTNVPVERDRDVVQLTSGDILRGTIQATDLSVMTPYGAVSVPVRAIETLSRIEQTATLRLNSGERLSGSLTTPTITLAFPGGGTLALPQTIVSGITFAPALATARPSGNFDRIEFANGDVVQGVIQDTTLTLAGEIGRLNIATNLLQAIVIEGDRQRFLLRNGDRITGSIANPNLTIRFSFDRMFPVAGSQVRSVQFATR
ncbi:MAG: PD40 domain-containing protein [Deinococcus sp.]|nr:PD40 domain-containing protein [Deinococcus sp.]